ncbi:hypothetical protein PACTADRAFT_110 [Pachysolen tannophilus NRRL Y-2460]|uniref:Iron transporter FTH1 n=1 Tax=Pachysolen tannophilus NRRL Y-2460 TaxID=669874 RepID=A0A1E4U0P1_PACTA|nr:hypothetical protein PACTADRAFT_110 [Pachysolen tannophilus NRRL Y-2460]
MFALENYFSAQAFFIILRETLESAIIVSVLLAFLKQSLLSYNHQTVDHNGGNVQAPSRADVNEDQDEDEVALRYELNETLYKKLRLQVWLGSFAGLFLCLMIGGLFIVAFYLFETDLWSLTEHYWEGAFSVFASVVISVLGLAMLRLNKLRDKWTIKLSKLLLANHTTISNSLENSPENMGNTNTTITNNSFNNPIKENKSNNFINFTEKYSMFFLPFITTLREGLEAVVFIGGIGINSPLSSIPLSLILGVLFGVAIGIFLYKSGDSMPLKIFLILSTCFLYLVAAGLFSKGIWQFELQHYINLCNGQDMSEVGSGPGSYDVTNSIWHVNCCNGEIDGGWMLFSAILGWTNSATYGSFFGYIAYWICVIVVLKGLLYEERNGILPFIPIKWQKKRMGKRLNFMRLAQKVSDSNSPLNLSNLNQTININNDRPSLDSSTPLIP